MKDSTHHLTVRVKAAAVAIILATGFWASPLGIFHRETSQLRRLRYTGD